jgi:hypothetical protein
MKKNIPALIFCLTFIGTFSAPSSAKVPESEAIGKLHSQTFHVEFKGRNLRVGDRVSILKYEDFQTDLKNHTSKNFPLKKKKVVIGEGVVSAVLNDNYYEFKSETPQYIPDGAFIEKL